MGARTAFLMHPSAPLHDPGWGHPEHQGRLRALAQAVNRDLMTLHGAVEPVEAERAGLEDALRVHSEDLLARVQQAVALAARRGEAVALDADTRVSGASWDAALGSLGAAVTGARQVAEGRFRNAFVATRPPGHHATADRAMGFCLVNHVAATARWLQAEGHAERVLIVDWDVHHGNGTQDVFWTDPSVFYLSFHQSPHYPGTGSGAERGGGRGEGFTRNVEVRARTSARDYLERFEEVVDEVLEVFSPDAVLVSAGFDCMTGDPLGGLLLEPRHLHRMTRTLMSRTPRHPGMERMVVCLEGGYDPARTGRGALAVIRALAGLEPHQENGPKAGGGEGINAGQDEMSG